MKKTIRRCQGEEILIVQLEIEVAKPYRQERPQIKS